MRGDMTKEAREGHGETVSLWQRILHMSTILGHNTTYSICKYDVVCLCVFRNAPITVTHPKNLSRTWSLLLRLALIFGSSSEFRFIIGWWHFDSMQGLSPFYHPVSLLACALLHFLSRVNFGVECCFRHCNLDLLPQQVRLEEGGSNKQITFVKH